MAPHLPCNLSASKLSSDLYIVSSCFCGFSFMLLDEQFTDTAGH